MQTWRAWAWVPFVAAAIVVADRLSKEWVRAAVPLNDSLVPFPALEPYFKLVNWGNTGAAFGILQGQGRLLVVVAIAIIAAVLVYLRHLPVSQWAVRLCLGLQLGGALGNLWDRLQFGAVTDFLLFSLPLNDRVLYWPAFNVADSATVVGVLLLAVLLLREEGQQPAPAVTAAGPAVDSPPAADERRSA
jgi:signal peptidase II